MSPGDTGVRSRWLEILKRARLRSWLIASLTLLAPLSVPAVEGEPELVPRCGGLYMLCGYVDKATKEERIPQRFEVAQPFSDGLAAVRVNGLYGFIDTGGKPVIAPRFQNAGPFVGEYAEVRLDGATGIVNRSGKIVVEPQFRRIVPFAGDTFIAQPFVVVANYPREVLRNDRPLEGIQDSSSLSSNNDSGLYHVKKGWLTDQKMKFAYFDKPERGLIWGGIKDKNYSDTWGLMRPDGSWQVTPRYGSVQQLWGTRAVVESMRDFSLPPEKRADALRRGAVDRDGNLVIPLKFPYLAFGRGEYGRAADGRLYKSDGTQNERKEAIVRPDGSLLANRYFDKVEIEDGELPRGRIGKAWYSIESEGNLIPDQRDGKQILACPGGLSIVERGESVEFRRPGDSKVVGTFDKGYFQARNCQNGIAAKRNGKWFVIFEDGAVLGGENGYENLSAFSGGDIGVKIDGKWGIIDRSGRFTVQPRFASLQVAPENTYAVSEGGETFWINASGERVAKPTKKWGPELKRSLACGGGLRFFQKDELWGLQDSDGKTVIEPKYPALSCFRSGVAWVAQLNPTQWCPIGPDGKRIETMECKKEYYPQIWSHSRPENLASGQYDVSIAWNRAWLDYHAGKRDEPPEWINMGYGYVRNSPMSK